MNLGGSGRLLAGTLLVMVFVGSDDISVAQPEPTQTSADGTVGEATVQPGALELAAAGAVAPIGFDEFPVGTTITDQYSGIGVVFTGTPPFIKDDNSSPSSPVLSGQPTFFGPIEGRFERSGRPSPVSYLSFDGGYFDSIGSTTLTVYDASGRILATRQNTRLGMERLTIDRATRDIAFFRIAITGTEPAGFAIDNLTFDRDLVYAALGDSYSSGEGAAYMGGSWFDNKRYLPGTASDTNRCHRSSSAYPQRIARAPRVDGGPFLFIACSGAVTDDILGPEGQYQDSPSTVPGALPQIQELEQFVQEQPVDFVTVGIGGNDIGFAEIIKRCVRWGRCDTGEWAQTVENTINASFYRLSDTYRAILSGAPGAEVYVFNYPQIFHHDRECGADLGITPSEGRWLRQRATQLNDVIADAAREAGVHLVDVEDVFGAEGTICGNTPKVHGYLAGWDSYWLFSASGVRPESFHPTPQGHELLASAFLDTYGDRLGANPNPASQPVTGPPVTDRVVFGNMTVTGDQNGVVVSRDDSLDVFIQNLADGTVVYTTTFSEALPGEEHVVDENGIASFSYEVPEGLETGPHTLEVTATTADGDLFLSTYDFHVMEAGGTLRDDDGSLFEAEIEALAFAGITKGCNPPANDRFCPDQPVTRGQMAAFLVRAFGYTDTSGDDLFYDDNGSVFESDINRLGAAAVTKGCNPPANDRFCPDQPVTRGQMAAFLTRSLELVPLAPPR